MSACKVITLLHGFTCFCTQYWDTFTINTCPCVFFSPLYILCFFLPNASTVNAQFIYFNLVPSHWLQKPHETFKKLKKRTNSMWEADCVFKKWSLWMQSLARMEFSFQIKSRTSQQTWNRLGALKLCAIYPQSCMEFLTILGTTALMASSSDTLDRYNHCTTKIWHLESKQLLILPKYCLPLFISFFEEKFWS